MKGLPAILRQLADIAEKNGGELPEDLIVSTTKGKTKQASNKQTGASIGQRIVKKHFYGRDSKG
jgi:hypothetical protein